MGYQVVVVVWDYYVDGGVGGYNQFGYLLLECIDIVVGVGGNEYCVGQFVLQFGQYQVVSDVNFVYYQQFGWWIVVMVGDYFGDYLMDCVDLGQWVVVGFVYDVD